MRKVLAFAFVVFMTSSAYSADKPLANQEQKTKNCVAQFHAQGIPEHEYKGFMNRCMGKTTTPQDIIKRCNAEAKTKGLEAKSDAREAFMRACRSAHP